MEVFQKHLMGLGTCDGEQREATAECCSLYPLTCQGSIKPVTSSVRKSPEAETISQSEDIKVSQPRGG